MEHATIPHNVRRVARRWRRSSVLANSRRLGPLECTLLALIVLGVAITVAMAILNPPS